LMPTALAACVTDPVAWMASSSAMRSAPPSSWEPCCKARLPVSTRAEGPARWSGLQAMSLPRTTIPLYSQLHIALQNGVPPFALPEHAMNHLNRSAALAMAALMSAGVAAQEITVSAAASLQNVLREVGAAYQAAHPGRTVHF